MTVRRTLLATCAVALAAPVVAPAPVGAATAIVALDNPTSIALGNGAPGTPYPSTITIDWPSLPVTHVEVVLHGVSHRFVDELSVLLVGPTGVAVVLTEVADGGLLDDVTLRFKDGAPPLSVPNLQPVPSGTYAPTDNGVQGSQAPAPAPAPTATNLSAFNGTNPRGTWSLFALDWADGEFLGGTISRGWTLELTVPSDLCLRIDSARFDDVSADDVHETAIDCIFAFGVANGKTETTFDPTGNVSRAQMATFVANAMDVAEPAPPPNVRNAFTDDDGTTHERAIDTLVAFGVIGDNGESGTSYFPSADMRRDHMASYLFEAFAAVTGAPLPAGPDAFADDAGNPHEAAIDALAAKGVVAGTGGGAYNPAGTVSRAQMGSFLARFLLLIDEAGAIA